MLSKKDMAAIDRMLREKGHFASWGALDTAHRVPDSDVEEIAIQRGWTEEQVVEAWNYILPARS